MHRFWTALLAASLVSAGAAAQQGARVTVTSVGKVDVEPDRYEYRVHLHLGEDAEAIETAAGALSARLREALLAEKVAAGGVSAEAAWRPLDGASAIGAERTAEGNAVLVVSVSASDAGAPSERVARLAGLRQSLSQVARDYVAGTPDEDKASLFGPFPALADETAFRQAAIGAAVKASFADAEAAAGALQGTVVSAESVEVGAATLKWGDDGANDRLRFRGEYTARAKVTYIIGAAR